MSKKVKITKKKHICQREKMGTCQGTEQNEKTELNGLKIGFIRG